MNVVVIGTGYVGLVSAVCFAEIGHDVVCVDLDPVKVDRINKGLAPISEPGLDEILARHVASGRVRATVGVGTSLRNADISMIAVGTPFDGRTIDLKYVRQAAADIGHALADAPSHHVVCVKSTVVPGTTDGVVGPILEQTSGRTIGVNLGLVMNPEFLAEGTAVRDFMEPDRIVIGASHPAAADVMRRLYSPFKSTDVVVTTTATAEMIKYTANSFLATVISFANEIGNLCAAVGDVDVMDVMAGVHLDRRLSPLTASGRVRPGLMSFLLPGTGFGGSCFPKDLKALVAFGERLGEPMRILKSVVDTNREQPEVTLRLLTDALGDVKGRHVTVLGLAFKPGTDDVRETPAEPIIRALVAAGADVTAHDPIAIHGMQAVLSSLPVRYTTDLADAVRGAAAVILVTSWPEYRSLSTLLDPGVAVIDGRRFLAKDAFANYRGIGLRESPRLSLTR